MAAYATGNDLVARYDIDVVGDLATDQRESPDRQVTPDLTNVATALLDASGEVDVALLSGGRYTPADLAALTGNSRYKLIRIVCDIAMSVLLQRRVDSRYQELAEQVAKISREHLLQLQRGENVFGIVADQNAGTIELQTVSAVEVDQRNTLPSRMERYFLPTSTRIPLRP